MAGSTARRLVLDQTSAERDKPLQYCVYISLAMTLYGEAFVGSGERLSPALLL